MPWLELSLELDAAHAQAFCDALLEAGADSVSLEDAAAGTGDEEPFYAEPRASSEPLDPGQSPDAPVPWRRSRVGALLAAGTDPRVMVYGAARMAGLSSLPTFDVSVLADEDWVRRTQAQFQPVRVSDRLWIVPSWHEAPGPEAIVVRLDPGVAFGTGSHPTTRLALRFLERAIAPGSSPCVLDYGCGSGILAITAALLGARDVDAVDLDPQALGATARNARANAVRVRAAPPQGCPDRAYDVVVANILANPLCELAPLFARRTRPGGWIALSGILVPQAASVIDAYAASFDLAAGEVEDGWVLLEGLRRARRAEEVRS